jgi:peptide/nickel transport system permease protein
MARDETPFRRIRAAFFISPTAVVGIVLLSLILVVALAAPWISPQNPFDPAQLNAQDGRLPPGAMSSGGTTFWLGTDAHGRDVLSAILYGLRTSFTVGVSSTLIALAIGLALGLGAACFGGRADALITRIADIELSFPAFLIALVVLAVLGQGMGKTIAALVAVQWAYFTRGFRRAMRAQMDKEYIEAARCLALTPSRIVLHHLLPNCLPAIFVIAAVQMAAAITLEATLSFLGLGVPLTEPSLGLLIADGYPYLQSGKYWISFFPGVALVLTIVSINLVADRLREVLYSLPQR